MSPVSRRHVLGTLALSLTAMSGCSEAGTEETPSATATERPFANSTRTPTSHKVRNSEGNPAIRSSAFTPTQNWDSARWIVTTPSQRDALEFSSEATGTAETKTFVDDTDLSEQTILIHQYSVEECLTRQLDRLQWGTTADGPEGTIKVSVEYTETERDESCQPDGSADIEATVMRIPIDGERIGYFSSLVT